MSTTARAGSAALTVDQQAVIVAIDRVSEGAGSRFRIAATAALEDIADAARSRWPVRTGRSRDAFVVASTVTGDAVAVTLANTATAPRWGFYAYRIKWSVRTKESIDAQVRGYGANATTAEGREAAEAFARKRIERQHGKGAPSAEVAGKQPWRILVLGPSKGAEQALITTAQADLDRLAGAT